MSIEVEFMGGPHDGAHIAVPNGLRKLRVPIPINLREFLREDTLLHPALEIRYVELDIVHYPWGSYVVWKETTC
jgi:hypothetical protein